MNRYSVFLICGLFSGCATSGTMEKPDSYVEMATSWKGGHIRDLIAVWGQPTNGFVEPSEYTPGIAGWKFDDKEKPNPYAEVKERTTCSGQSTGYYGQVNVNCNTRDTNASARQGYEMGRGFKRSLLRHCSITVQFDKSGIIFDVMAYSKNCGSRKEGAYDAFSRPAPNKPQESATNN